MNASTADYFLRMLVHGMEDKPLTTANVRSREGCPQHRAQVAKNWQKTAHTSRATMRGHREVTRSLIKTITIIQLSQTSLAIFPCRSNTPPLQATNLAARPGQFSWPIEARPIHGCWCSSRRLVRAPVFEVACGNISAIAM